MTRPQYHKMFRYLSLLFAFLLAAAMFGCEGDRGPAGPAGTSFGTVSGQVLDTGGNKLAGITVAPTPGVTGVANANTDNNGNFSLTLPNGSYTLTYSRPGYATQTQTVTVVATQTTTVPTVTLTQTSPAVVNVSNVSFGNVTTATFTATALANSPELRGQPATFQFFDQAGNPIATTALPGGGATATVAQPRAAALVSSVSELAKVRQSVYPPGHDPLADLNDFDVPDFETLDRLQVLPISQQAFEQGANTTFRVHATIQGTNGVFQTFSTTAQAGVPTNRLPFVPNGGIRNVPIGQPVVIQGRVQATYNWTITAPGGSAVTSVVDATTRFPHFIPDVAGKYVVSENATGTTRTINIYAGTYDGILAPTADDNPLGNVRTACSTTGCHSGATYFNTPYNGAVQFFSNTPVNSVFADWSGSGHRQIMVQGMNSGHYSLNACAKCHSVGWSQYSSSTAKAGGFNEVARAVGFTDATWRANAPKFFKNFPQVLRLSEVQCETCHGPNSTAHATSLGGAGDADAIGSRFSVASDVCGVCHGEPLRHGRYQEWRVSGHGDFQTAMNEVRDNAGALRTSCVGCHTGQAFPLFLSQLQGTNGNAQSPLRTLNATNTGFLSFLNASNVQPQTCAVCHPVHNPGTESGLTGAIVILRGDYQAGGTFAGTTPLLPGGFQATGVGKGALCITCHNSRNGGVASTNTATLHEDGDPNFGTIASYDAPHEACQGDVLMGHNAYFFGAAADTHGPGTLRALPAQVGQRSAHSFLPDTCVTCHMLKSPTDPTLGYPPGIEGAGTNHTFNIVTDPTRPAADQINALCSQCHGGFQGTGLQASFDASYRQLLIAAGNAILRIKFGTGAVPAGSRLVFIPGRSPAVSFNGAAAQTLVSFLANAPGTANTGPIGANGFQIDLAKANWNTNLVAPKYLATQLNGSSYDDGTPIATSATVSSVQVAGDQSKAVHNPSFVNNVINATIVRLNSL